LTDGPFREGADTGQPVTIWLNLNSKAEVDGLHEAWKNRGARIVAAPESKPWNLHEFTAADLDGNLLRVFYDFAWELPDRGGRVEDTAQREAARARAGGCRRSGELTPTYRRLLLSNRLRSADIGVL
jgi:hypothetical protein